MLSVEVTITTGEGETTIALPGKHDVCGECDGHGTHLREGMRDHAYTAEEFSEAFDDEQASEYFRHGGIYDVTCSVCKGVRVVVVVDREACTSAEEKAGLVVLDCKAQADREYEALCRSEQEYGC
jgi:hypothetical protein